MLGQAVAMIMVNTGGVHDTNKYSSQTSAGTLTAAASAPATSATTSNGITATDISSLLSILGPLLTSITGLPSSGLSAVPLNVQPPVASGWPGATKFAGGLGGGSSLKSSLFAPSTSNLRDITELVTTIYTVINNNKNNNNARFHQGLPQYNPYEYKEYYAPPVVQYIPQKFLYDQPLFPNYQLIYR